MTDSFLGGFLGGFGGGTIGRAVVDLVLNNAQYEEQLASSEAQTKASTGGMSKSTMFAGGAMTAVYAAAGIAAVDFAKNAVGAAIEQQQATERLTVSIENSKNVTMESAGAFNQQANSLRDLTGVSDEAVTSGQALLVQMGLQATQITQLTPLVVDLAAKNNIDLNAAFKAVGKAALGSTGALARYVGPVVKGKDASETFANVLTKLGAVEGFAAKQANAEPWKKLGAQWHELEENIGAELLPVLQSVVGGLVDIFHWLQLIPDASKMTAASLAPTTNQFEQLAVKVRDGKLSLDQAAAALIQLQEQAAIDTWGPLTEQQQASFESAQALADGEKQITYYLGLLPPATGKASRSLEDMSAKEREAARWARVHKDAIDQLAGSLDVTGNVFDDFSGKVHVSTTSILRDFDKQLKTLQHYGDNMQELEHRNVPRGLLDQLQALGIQGAGVVEALATANKQQFDQIVSDWKQSQHEANNTANGIEHALHPLTKGYKIPVTFDLSIPIQSIESTVSQAVGNIADQVQRALNNAARNNGGKNGLK